MHARHVVDNGACRNLKGVVVSPALYPHSLEFYLLLFAKRSIFQFLFLEARLFLKRDVQNLRVSRV